MEYYSAFFNSCGFVEMVPVSVRAEGWSVGLRPGGQLGGKRLAASGWAAGGKLGGCRRSSWQGAGGECQGSPRRERTSIRSCVELANSSWRYEAPRSLVGC